jgi:hypothetical protein
MFDISGKIRSTAASSTLSGRLIACLIFLLLTAPLIELAHADSCEQHACAVCTSSLDPFLSLTGHLTGFVLNPAKVIFNQVTTKALQIFPRAYDSRGPPKIS